MNEIVDSFLIANVPSAEDIEEKKYISKILSIQYSVFSALQIRAVLSERCEKDE
jgi:hypothetical protein